MCLMESIQLARKPQYLSHHDPKKGQPYMETRTRFISRLKGRKQGQTCVLLGELAKFGLNAAMPHAHPGQS